MILVFYSMSPFGGTLIRTLRVHFSHVFRYDPNFVSQFFKKVS